MIDEYDYTQILLFSKPCAAAEIKCSEIPSVNRYFNRHRLVKNESLLLRVSGFDVLKPNTQSINFQFKVVPGGTFVHLSVFRSSFDKCSRFGNHQTSRDFSAE